MAKDGSEREAPRASSLSRRAFVMATVSVIGHQAVGGWPSAARERPAVPDDPTRVPGEPPRGYGKRSRFETATRLAGQTSSLTPHQTLHGVITPNALHFERHHNGVPLIDPSRHRLLVHGLVERPLVFSMQDLVRFPAVSRLLFIECSGNSGGEWSEPGGRTVQETHGLMSTAEWTGVRLATILRECGVDPNAAWLLAEGSDAAAMARSIPLSKAMDDALLCYAQNGEALRPEQGYPLRLVLPGWEGNMNIKWLRRLELGQGPWMTREETARYTDLMPDGTARQFTFVMEAKSVITHPSGGQRLTEPGFVEIRGLAWSGRGRIARVEVSADGGREWRPATLQDPVLPMCQTRFRIAWRWDGREAILQSRCIDDTGYVQPTRQALIDVRGVHSGYHFNGIQGWKVRNDGWVVNSHRS